MVRLSVSAVVILAAGHLISAPCFAAPPDTTVTYALNAPPSSFEYGCQGPCECPIVSTPTFGSFDLVRTGTDALYTYYNVERYIASFNNGPGAVSITGSGRYKIGGEFALMQEMTLDLDIEGHPTQHFDSGLKPVEVPFPRINVSCSVHGFYCFDSVLVVDAKPTDIVGTPAPGPHVGFQAILPNPFERGARFAFTLDRAGPVDLLVIDPAGRLVRVLAAEQFFGPGPQGMDWDGRRDDGRLAPAGVYWAVMRWSGGTDRRRIVKLD